MLVLHQPAVSKLVGDLFICVRVTDSAAWQDRLDAAAARELDGVKFLVKTTENHAAKEPCSSRNLRKCTKSTMVK